MNPGGAFLLMLTSLIDVTLQDNVNADATKYLPGSAIMFTFLSGGKNLAIPRLS